MSLSMPLSKTELLRTKGSDQRQGHGSSLTQGKAVGAGALTALLCHYFSELHSLCVCVCVEAGTTTLGVSSPLPLCPGIQTQGSPAVGKHL